MKRVLTTVVVITAVFIACKKDKPKTAPAVTTAALTNITTTSATAGGTITSDGNAGISAAGVVWSKTNNTPTVTDSVKASSTTTGSFTVNLTGLDFNTTYYIRAYATNSIGTSYGSVVTLNTSNDTSKVRFTYSGQTVTYGVIISPTTSRKWLDRNLGASRVATAVTDTAAYGHWFQWGRLADGHQSRTAGSVNVQSSTDVPGHANAITTFSDWRNPSNDNLWQGSSGVNNPCPSGWHVPTRTEWEAETAITDTTSGFNILKLTAGGYRGDANAAGPQVIGTRVYCWTSTPDGFNAYFYRLSSTKTTNTEQSKAQSMAIRCIKD